MEELPFIQALAKTFGCLKEEVVEIYIHARMNEANVQRKTTLIRAGQVIKESNWNTVKRAAR